MAKRRFILELTEAELNAVLHCAVRGQVDIESNGLESTQKHARKMYSVLDKIATARLIGMKTIKQ